MKKRKSVVVELTSLLDVIFIMLFMVMNRSSNAAAQAKTEAAEQVMLAESERDRYKEILGEVEAERKNLEHMQNRINGYEIFDEYAEIVSVYVLDMSYKRSVVVADDGEIAEIDFGWDNMSYGREELTKTLTEYIESTENPVFITFSYDGNDIYRQDYNMISEAITAVQADYDDVYIKFDDKSK